ncbi:hypothetical protein TVAG_475610 [Trichomonas vaginalis G3]|uniref:Surface antigen BspA-like n=1 Tax=Trichomonas vaginalis (strain ATCC PRA-98 / G3) TaxID=412133 RepID=A2D9Y5_TRIV3|nr:ribonuclease inhibitor domain-containing protein [Trichomonas vaginalis G3]EAY22633.1 hypothetical protein TVAG_475610 [Trichomonas vaginalis G3]KAI5525447.1 ribonuclease inhibitor domain-containing protein [Trichomonas vaginalis G3]|eukprot:XP_001583619.1 hypothetical protein [Trichomonas vaginalis G3]
MLTGTYYIPNSVKRIYGNAFCFSRLNEIIIPESCTQLEYGCFHHMYDLIYLRIPKSISIIHLYVIDNCPNLRNLTIEMESIPQLEYQSVQIITLGNETKVIEDYALIKAVNLLSIIIPPSVTKIGVEAFRGLKNLKSVRIYGQPSIGRSAFMDTKISCGVDCYSSLIDPLISSGMNNKSFNYCCLATAPINVKCFKFLLDFQIYVFIIL